MAETLKEELLRLIAEDRTFRLAVAGALGLAEIIESIRELSEAMAENSRAIRLLQEQVRELQERVAEHTRILIEHTAAIKALQEQIAEHTKLLVEHTSALRALQERAIEHSLAIRNLQEHVAELSKSVRSLSRTVSAVGARWGVLSEEAFWKAMQGVVGKLFGGKVERWTYFDEEGIVFGHPSAVEVDLVVQDKEHVLIEVKASASRGDVRELRAIGKLYEKVTGVKPRLALVSPFVEPRALELAARLGVEVYTGSDLEE